MSELRSTVRELCLYFVGIEATRPGLSGLELTRPQTAMGRLSLCPRPGGRARRSSSAARARSSSEKTSQTAGGKPGNEGREITRRPPQRGAGLYPELGRYGKVGGVSATQGRPCSGTIGSRQWGPCLTPKILSLKSNALRSCAQTRI